MIFPLYNRILLIPFRILGLLLFIIPFIAMLLSGYEDEGCTAISWIIGYGNKADWRE